jgi:hypothetical protein
MAAHMSLMSGVASAAVYFGVATFGCFSPLPDMPLCESSNLTQAPRPVSV